jgi:hypothetical protein
VIELLYSVVNSCKPIVDASASFDDGEVFAATGRFDDLVLRFENQATLRIGAIADTDSIAVTGDSGHRGSTVVDLASDPLGQMLIGSTVFWMCQLTGHTGYVDGVQIELRRDREENGTIQIMVGASALEILEVRPFKTAR